MDGHLGDDWTLIDSFERDGRRYIVAVENPAVADGFERLSARERQVVGLSLRGLHDKAVAHELGLAHSTVRVLMRRAIVKCGALSRRDLLERARGMFGPSEDAPATEFP